MEYIQSAPIGITDQRMRDGSRTKAWCAAMLVETARCMANPSALDSGRKTASHSIPSTIVNAAKPKRSAGARSSMFEIARTIVVSSRRARRKLKTTGVTTSAHQTAG